MKPTFPNEFNQPEHRKALHRLYWEEGFLRYLLKPDLQTRIYDFTNKYKKEHPNSAMPIIWDEHRAAGKTFELALLGIERGMSKPGQEIRFGSKSISQAHQIVEPNIRKIIAMKPDGFMATLKRDFGCPYYELYNPAWPPGSFPSRFWIVGCREQAEMHRGKRSNMILLDECREIENFEYIAKVVFGPHFATMENPVYIMASTPPESMDHAWSRVYCARAMREGTYYKGPVVDDDGWPGDKDWRPEDDAMMLELFLSKDSPEWQREMLCRHISDPTRLIVPEFDEKLHVVDEYERPQYLYPLVVADGGYVDFFACLFGYIDFSRHKLVIEDSVVVNRKHIGEIHRLIAEKEGTLFGVATVGVDGAPSVHYPVRPIRHADMRPMELATLSGVFKYPFEPAPNHDPDEQIASLRTRIMKNQVVILRRNKELIVQLKNAIRDEKGRLTRSEEWGHWDAVMALVYMANVAPWLRNPGYEQECPFDWTTQQIPKGAFRDQIKGMTRDEINQRRRWDNA